MAQTQLVIFLGCVGITLIGNTVALWFIYKAYANMTRKLTEISEEMQAQGAAMTWIRSVQAVSEQAVTATEATRKQVQALEPLTARAESRLGFELARVDFRVEKFCGAVSSGAQKVQGVVAGPAHRLGAVIAGFSAAMEVIAQAENDADATSRPKK